VTAARPATPATRKKSRREVDRVVILTSSDLGHRGWPMRIPTAPMVIRRHRFRKFSV
jgi:hypothetical protein